MAILFEEEARDKNLYPIGSGLVVRKCNNFVEVYRNGVFLYRRDLDWREKTPEFRLLIVLLVKDHNAHKTKLSNVFVLSRQAIDNWISSYEKDKLKGLINSTKNLGNSNRSKGNKAKQHASDRMIDKQNNKELEPTLYDPIIPEVQDINDQDEPYAETMERQTNRYAGVFAVMILLVSNYKWFNWVVGFFGNTYKIFQIFVLMSIKNIRSIEQLKNIRLKEAGAIIGIGKIPSLPGVWDLFYQAAKKKLSALILYNFFSWQITGGFVSNRFWFTDGHVLPYSGNQKMHVIFNTKKREVEPGCMNFVSCDIQGRIIDFEIKEGGAGLRQHIIELHDKWQEHFSENEYPVHVFDREGDGCDFFYELVKRDCPFVTWEKNSDRKKLYNFPESDFTGKTTVNGVEYLYFEDQKEFISTDKKQEKHPFTLRRFYVINTSTQKRTSALAYNGKTELSEQDCIYAILNRWGASENTFKHMGNQQHTSYRPGFKLLTSENQTIPNPEIKVLDKKIKSNEKEYTRKCKILSEKDKKENKSGKVRANDAYSGLKIEIQKLKNEKLELTQQKSMLPEKIDVSGLEDYRSFKTHDNEGKNLFDFAGSLVWNARKNGVEILEQLYPFKNDVVDLFYAIINCQGTIQITDKEIRVILEPLQQASRRAAQIDFCKKITELGAKTRMKKSMIIQVDKAK
ncbi:MAG: hypothetical protein KAI79_18685 [Bacteroidales bacterium]|nr:hypothetical protein [Bacteroidales bacterium]